MKNLMKLGLFAMLGLLIFTTGCNDDDDPITVVKPTATLEAGGSYADQTWEPGRLLGPITVTFKAGDADLNGVYLYRNGEKLSISEFLVDEESKAANPFNLTADQKQEVTFDFDVILSEDEVTDTYSFMISDTDNNTAQVDLEITTEVQGTPVEQFEAFLLYNKDGQQPGGLNLDAENADDASVSYNSADAHIRDAGIDMGQPNSQNWIQKILPANGAALMPFDGDFDAVTMKEQIEELFDGTATVDTSDKVEEGDLFIVHKNGRYYLLKTIEVNVTADDNNDYYKFDIKR